MQGNIDFSGTLSGSIAGGGGGGSVVTITPTLQSGTKIADFSIDSESGSLYAPTPPQSGVLDVQVNNTQTPDYESIVENNVAKLDLYPYLEKSEAYTIIDLLNDEIELVDGKVGNLEQIIPYKQDKLTAGNNINIDQNNVISASGVGGINYSTSEQDTGLLWYDGSKIYQKTFTKQLSGYTTNIDISDLNIKYAWLKDGFFDIGVTCISLNEWMSSNAFSYVHINQGTTPPYIDISNRIGGQNATIYVTIQYVKNTV